MTFGLVAQFIVIACMFYFFLSLAVWMGVPPFYRNVSLFWFMDRTTKSELPSVVSKCVLPVFVGFGATAIISQLFGEWIGFLAALPMLLALIWAGLRIRRLIESDHIPPPIFLTSAPFKDRPMALYDGWTVAGSIVFSVFTTFRVFGP